jgi:hypothetical protein
VVAVMDEPAVAEPTGERAVERKRVKRIGIAVPSVLGLDLTFLAGSAWGQGRAVAVFVALTALTGFADSQGFIHASRIWHDGQVIWREVWQSGLAFMIGVVAYWAVVRMVAELGVRSAVLQTMGWFAVTIAAVVLTDSGGHRWQLVDTATAAVVVAGLGLLLYRTGA